MDNKVNECKNFEKTKTIAILLDLDGTSDFIDDEKAKKFIKQLDFIREKFAADLCTISISTHFNNSVKIQEILEIFANNVTQNVRIGLNFYYGGIYDFEKKQDFFQGYNFNSDKISVFDKYYVNNCEFDNQWFAIIDDRASETVYKQYQNNHPMLLCRPSQDEHNLKYNCFMNVSTTTFGFDGVLESLQVYMNSIYSLTPEQILDKQKNMIIHLSAFGLTLKVMENDFMFVHRYFKEGFADEDDYQSVLELLIWRNSIDTATKEEIVYLKGILDSILEKFQIENDTENLEKIKQLQKHFKIMS